MASQSNIVIGWDLIYKLVEDSIKQESDIIIALVHWCLILKGYKCLGVGSDKTLNENEESSEILPTGWNDGEIYSLRYILNDELYILHAFKTDDYTFTANFLHAKSKTVSNMSINLDEIVKTTKGTLNIMVPNSSEVLNRIRKELIDPHNLVTKKEVETQTPEKLEPRRNLREIPTTNRPCQYFVPQNYGVGDLDPLGRGGGGMLFEPRTPNMFNNPQRNIGVPHGFPGYIPPGARFDPLMPPMPNLRGEPDNDHFQPPTRWNNNDDMYM